MCSKGIGCTSDMGWLTRRQIQPQHKAAFPRVTLQRPCGRRPWLRDPHCPGAQGGSRCQRLSPRCKTNRAMGTVTARTCNTQQSWRVGVAS